MPRFFQHSNEILANQSSRLVRKTVCAVLSIDSSIKGGVGRTTTAIHLAAFLNQLAPTLLVECDPRSTTLEWYQGWLPYRVEQVSKCAELSQEFTHTVIDTDARYRLDTFRTWAESSDWLTIPAQPHVTGDVEYLKWIVEELRSVPDVRCESLLTRVPARGPQALRVRAQLEEQGIPLFTSKIPNLTAFPKAAYQRGLVQTVPD